MLRNVNKAALGALIGLVAVLVIVAILALTGDDERASSGGTAAPAATATVPVAEVNNLGVVSEERWAASIKESAEFADENRDRFPAEGAVSAAFPAMDPAATASAVSYIEAFTRQVLTVDYAAATWEELMSWVRWEVAPSSSGSALLTDEDATVLQLDMLQDPPNSPGTLIPTPEEWQDLHDAGAVQSVRDLVVVNDPDFDAALATGKFTLNDPLVDCLDVVVTIVRTVGKAESSSRVSFTTCTGSAVSHDGYGWAGINELRDLS